MRPTLHRQGSRRIDTRRNTKCPDAGSPSLTDRIDCADFFRGIEAVGALIFDFDGVSPDSEAIANSSLAETVSDFGYPTTMDQALIRYSGRRWIAAMSEIETL